MKFPLNATDLHKQVSTVHVGMVLTSVMTKMIAVLLLKSTLKWGVPARSNSIILLAIGLNAAFVVPQLVDPGTSTFKLPAVMVKLVVTTKMVAVKHSLITSTHHAHKKKAITCTGTTVTFHATMNSASMVTIQRVKTHTMQESETVTKNRGCAAQFQGRHVVLQLVTM
jgi:hypothetical protein